MKSYRFLLTPRWLLGHLVALGLVLLFVNFGFWQLRRLEARQEHNALLETRLATAPTALAELKARYDEEAPAAAEDAIVYRRARVSGRYDPGNEVLLRRRAHRGQPGYHVLTPLVTRAGRAILVDRGWVPYEMDAPPIQAASPPEGEVTVSGILFANEEQPQGFLAPKDPPEGELGAVFWVDTERLEEQLPYALEPLYLELGSQSPAQSGRLPVLPPPPELTRGPHLSYALQWFSFALIGLIGYPILLRQVAKDGGRPKQTGVSGNAASG